MPIDFSGLPDKQGSSTGLDLSGLPDKAAPAPAQPPADPTFLERLGGWKGIGATGIRGLSGLLSAEGGPVGAATSGLGETLAEALEQGTLSPNVSLGRVGTEAALGAVPFGKIVQGGKIATSALRSGLLGAVGTGAREVAEGQSLDPTAIATGGGIGALLGAGGSAWAGRAKPEVFEVQPTDRGVKAPLPIRGSGVQQPPLTPSVMAGEGRVAYPGNPTEMSVGARRQAVADAVREARVQAAQPKADTGELIRDQNNLSDVMDWRAKQDAARVKAAAVPTSSPKADTGEIIRDQKNLADVMDWRAAQDKQKLAAARIQEAIDSGMVAEQPKVSETVSAPTPTGKATLSQRYGFPEEEEGGNLNDLIPGPSEFKEPSPGELLHNGATSAPEADAIRQENLRPEAPTAEVAATAPNTNAQYPEVQVEAQAPPLPEVVRPSRKPGASASQKFDSKVQKILDASGEPTSTTLPESWQPFAEGVEPPAAAEPQLETDPLSRMLNGGQPFKSQVDAAGQGYRDVKELFKAGEVPKEGYTTAGRAAKRIAKEAGIQPNPSAMDTAPLGPADPVPTPAQNLDWVKEQQAAVDELTKAKAAGDPSFLERLKGMLGSESGTANTDPSQAGFATPKFLKAVGMPLTGAAIGAPVGAAYDTDNPDAGAIKGALAGAVLGTAAAGGGKELINWRNAGLLTGPAQIKKPLSDLGAYIGMMAEKGLSSDPIDRAQAPRLLAEALRVPTNVANYAKGMTNPELASHVIGDIPQESRGALGFVARPFAAAQYGTQQAMERAGVPLPEARQDLFLGDPESKLGQALLGLQQFKTVQALRPFARISTNLFERGMQRVPGVSYAAPSMGLPALEGNPSTKLARSILGAGAIGAGAVTGGIDRDNAAEGTPTSSVTKGLRRALLASYGVPFTIGEAIGGQEPREIYNMIPGISQVVPPPASNDTIGSYLKKLGSRQLDQILPAFLSPDTQGSSR